MKPMLFRSVGRWVRFTVPLALAVSMTASEVRLRIAEGTSKAPLSCLVFLRDAEGLAVRPPGLPFWRDHFACDSEAQLDLTTGRYSYEVDRGPEYRLARGEFLVREGVPVELTVRLKRLVDLAAEGWWSGETHVHRRPADIELLMRASDLHVAEVITWWNRNNPWRNRALPENPVRRFDGNRFADLLAGEDERGGGALMYFGRREPLDITGAAREFPPSVRFLRAAKADAGTWVDAEKPFWRDFPVWLASGQLDSVGICQNHLQRGGMLDNEAWGRPRDRARYPGPLGNGFWTQDIYYHALNCGFRLPPSAGSASGVLPNPVGYNRMYAHVKGELTYANWWAAVRAGRVFVSNGPLLRCAANGQLPGHVFRGQGSLTVQLTGQLDSRDPIAALELVRNGRVEPLVLPARITLRESGWFLVRARADVPHTFRFASTAPWYVEIGANPRPVRRESARFFLDWVRERRTGVKLDDPAQQREVQAAFAKAERFWRQKVEEATPKIRVTGCVVDDATGAVIPARLYIRNAAGRWFFPVSASSEGTAIRYEKQNWINHDAVEYHTTLSADPFQIDLPPGRYTVTAERGKEYAPLTREFEVGDAPLDLRLPLHRWINLAARGWYSGDTHVHRTLEELPNVMLAEDVNVTFPLVYWVTRGLTPPARGDKNLSGEIPSEPIKVDANHVIWPRNTEWEIFSVSGKRHTLGAVFALGHQGVFTQGAPPVKPIAAAAHRQGALLDLDKHDWPWSMALVSLMGVDLYELANNHMWRTEFSMTRWSTPAPAWMRLPNNGRHGSETDWIRYTLQNYYALLDSGWRLRPSAGTANGVHPVPLGFGRVYVSLPGGFDYRAWFRGLNAGRSFVTTGPMLFAQVDGQPPGAHFTLRQRPTTVTVTGEVVSEQPVSAVEILLNGRVRQRLELVPQRNSQGAFTSRFDTRLEWSGSAWLAVRCWEPRPDGRMRFAHTAPFWFDLPGQPTPPPSEEIAFLIARVRNEIKRSTDRLPPSAIEEYRQALAAYEAVAAGHLREPSPMPGDNTRPPKDAADLRFWLQNLLVEHGFTLDEAVAATGLTREEIQRAAEKFNLTGRSLTQPPAGTPLKVLPYPGGRHPRIGFLEGAIEPQRDTKISVFAPWDATSHVVVDLPEALWSNLGLTYLAHTHIPTIWDDQGVKLPPIEWNRRPDGTLDFTRTLPNGLAFGARVSPASDGVRMELWVRNGTDHPLTRLRAQNCVMFKDAPEFAATTHDNKVLRPPYAACRSRAGARWIITAWEPLDRVWENPPVPCLHSDPAFPDCPPGKTVRARGGLWFYEGEDLEAALRRIEASGWRTALDDLPKK